MSKYRTRSHLNKKMRQMEEKVKLANKVDDPLLLLSKEDIKFETSLNMSPQNDLEFKHFNSIQLPGEALNWMMDLITRNMKLLYEDCGWGWNAKEKLSEFTDKEARFVIAFNQEKPIGFTHFRFDMDYERPVLYCYELQIEENARKYGLGRQIMEILEKMASLTKMNFVVLTVMKKNPAIVFFQKIGYSLDETSPDDKEAVSYYIYSKKITSS